LRLPPVSVKEDSFPFTNISSPFPVRPIPPKRGAQRLSFPFGLTREYVFPIMLTLSPKDASRLLKLACPRWMGPGYRKLPSLPLFFVERLVFPGPPLSRFHFWPAPAFETILLIHKFSSPFFRRSRLFLPFALISRKFEPFLLLFFAYRMGGDLPVTGTRPLMFPFHEANILRGSAVLFSFLGKGRCFAFSEKGSPNFDLAQLYVEPRLGRELDFLWSLPFLPFPP